MTQVCDLAFGHNFKGSVKPIPGRYNAKKTRNSERFSLFGSHVLIEMSCSSDDTEEQCFGEYALELSTRDVGCTSQLLQLGEYHRFDAVFMCTHLLFSTKSTVLALVQSSSMSVPITIALSFQFLGIQIHQVLEIVQIDESRRQAFSSRISSRHQTDVGLTHPYRISVTVNLLAKESS